jgi:hypothetical protein
MDCKITSTTKARRRAFTLAEIMVASGVAGIFFMVLGSLTFFAARSFVAMANYVDLENKSRLALDILSHDIRQSDSLASGTSNQIVLNFTNATQVTFTYDPGSKTLTRTFNGVIRTNLLTECESLRFSMFQRNPINGTYDQFPVGTPGTCKLIQMDWKCSRQILKARVNTEVVQSAKIVIRRQ